MKSGKYRLFDLSETPYHLPLDKDSVSIDNARMSYAHHLPTAHDACFVRAYAKINLTLDVLDKRADGYHELATVMQTVDLYDTICLSASDDERVQVICTDPALSGADNLVARAALAVRQRLTLTRGVVIELHKRVPVAAGLGGGSSDAAAVLRALRHWWRLPLSEADLFAIAASLGSDVPFFLHSGLALCHGRGEQVTQLSPRWPLAMRWLLLLKPAISLSTAQVYRDLSSLDYTDGTHSRAMRAALETGSEPESADLHNCLERGVLARYPEVARARQAFLQAGARLVRLSGSGPTLFAPFAELAQAAEVQQKLQAQGYELHLTRPVYPDNEITLL